MCRFAGLVDTPENMAAFRARYRIPNGVELQHYELGEWLFMNRPPSSIVILMITFIKGGMEIPIGRVTRDFLMNYRLTPTQYSPNIFRVLDSIDMIFVLKTRPNWLVWLVQPRIESQSGPVKTPKTGQQPIKIQKTDQKLGLNWKFKKKKTVRCPIRFLKPWIW